MRRSTNDRLVGVFAVWLVLAGVLWVRCVWLQLVEGRRLASIAEAQHLVSQSLLAQRGTVYDRTGRVLAFSTLAPSVFANARQVVEPASTAARLAPVVHRDAAMIARRLERDKAFVWIARQLDPGVTSTVHAFRREGIGIVEEPKRLFPQGKLAAHLLGYVDIDQRGLEGIEWALDGVLRGRRGWQATIRDAKGQALIGPWTVTVDPLEGYDVYLTIDSTVQQVVEDALEWGIKKFHAKGGSIVVLEPATGAILALANRPTFDPNAPSASPADARRNRAITDLLEPGSVLKVVTASALLEEDRVRLDERFFCERGNFPTVARHILHDHRPHGWLTFHDVIALSSNIGTAKAAQRLTRQELYHSIRAFGFGRKTGIDLPGEVSGMIAPPERWSKLSPFIIPIGQEIAVSPIQLAVMTAVVANGGWPVKPYVVQRITTRDGRVIRARVPARGARILSPQTIESLQTMLISVVESGTGRLAKIQGLTVAGKTGTAQKLEPDGRYSHSRYVASFVGFGPVPDSFPLNDPSEGSRVAIAITVDEPRGVYFGGSVAAPMFRRIMEQLKAYWDEPIQPTPTLANPVPVLPAQKAQSPRTALLKRSAASYRVDVAKRDGVSRS